MKNAIIKTIRWDTEHGGLSCNVTLDYGGSCQGFGGYVLFSPVAWKDGDCRYGNICGYWVYQLMAVAGVDDLQKIIGKAVRVKFNDSWKEDSGPNRMIQAIGHITQDIWLDPAADFFEFDKKRQV